MAETVETRESLSTTLADVRRRLLAIGLTVGLGWAAVCAIVFVLLWMWIDLVLELTPGLRVVADVGALVTAGAIVALAAGWSRRLGETLALARRLDHTAGTRGQILTGVDLMEGSRLGEGVQGSRSGVAEGSGFRVQGFGGASAASDTAVSRVRGETAGTEAGRYSDARNSPVGSGARQGDQETRGQGDKETRGQGDQERMGQGDGARDGYLMVGGAMDGLGAGVLGPGLTALAIERASELAGRVSRSLAVPLRPLFWPMGSLVVLLGGILILALAAPRLAGTQWRRFADPFGDHPPYSRVWFEVQPGDVRVIYGDGLDVRAQAFGGTLEKAELVLLGADGSREDVLPMFPEPNNVWRAGVANVTIPQRYFVRAGRARSRRFDIGIVTVPRFEQVVFKITPPAYTHQSAYEGPLPQGGVVGLRGTAVQVRVKSNRPLAGGVIEVSGFRVQGSGNAAEIAGVAWASGVPRERSLPVTHGGTSTQATGKLRPGVPDLRLPMPPGQVGSEAAIRSAVVGMSPGSEPREAVGTFVISGKGQASIWLTDIDNQNSKEPFTFPITVLADERPFVRIVAPEQESLATPDANVPVELAAEDDYGLSRVRLYRSLNESRALPADVMERGSAEKGSGTFSRNGPEGEGDRGGSPNKHKMNLTPFPPRWNGTTHLPLGECGVEPGDVIKIFARAEDNDPDGAKGAESTVVTIRIISQNDYEHLLLAREGLEVLQAKYDQASRHLESLQEAVQELLKEIEKEPPESPLSDKQREQLDQLADEFAKAARDIAKAAKEKLPYDLDEKLSPELEKLAGEMKEAAKQADKLAQSKDLSVSGLDEALRKLAEKIGGDRGEFDEKAVKPLERLAAVYPLMEDSAMYLMLYQRQRDLAERLASLKGKDSGDDPGLRGRMRDLELEQKQIREGLSELLDKVEEHAMALPEDPKLERLRDTAQKFARDVRDSGATEAQTDAETGLAEFSGARGAEKSREAADIMEKFVGRCGGKEGMGEEGKECLMAFRPMLGASMGNTLDQLLAEAGMPKIGRGMGIGAGDGYSMQRTSLQNVGLYGSLPRLREVMDGGRRGKEARRSLTARRPGVRNEAEPLTGDRETADQAMGTGGVEVPVQYRQKVGRYFERIADEMGEEGAKGSGHGVQGSGRK